MQRLWILCAVILVIIGLGGSLTAQSMTSDARHSFFADMYSDAHFVNPISMAFAPDGRLFVAERGGTIWMIRPSGGSPSPAAFARLAVDSTDERGVLGLALDPNFSANGYVYVYYTPNDVMPRRNRLSRLTASGNMAQVGSETILATFDSLDTGTHNGGALQFGADGDLYVAVGDNGLSSNAQSLETRHGKILRYHPDGSIPTDNPFYAGATGDNRAIWALGVQNPSSLALNPADGALFINDAGLLWQEINQGVAGANYGWPLTEGDFTPAAHPTLTRPRSAYQANLKRCAISAGVFYPEVYNAYPKAYRGDYFYADYCASWIRSYDLIREQKDIFASGFPYSDGWVDLEIGADGQLYGLTRQTGRVYRYRYNHPQPTYSPMMTSSLTPTTTPNPPVNQSPIPVILSPAYGAPYQAGQVITVIGSATDSEDGALGKWAFLWNVDFYKDGQKHFLYMMSEATEIRFTIPRRFLESDATNVFYRVTLTARDSVGGLGSTILDLYPQVATTTIDSSPSGLMVTINDQLRITPFTLTTVVGTWWDVNAPLSQQLGGTSYRFDSWITPDGVKPSLSWIMFAPAGGTVTLLTTEGTQTELLRNGDMESSLNIDGEWMERKIGGKNSSAWRICQPTIAPVAFEADCAVGFGSMEIGRGGKIVQKVRPALTKQLHAGDTLTMTVCASGEMSPAYRMKLLTVEYADGVRERLSVDWPGGSFPWLCQRKTLTLAHKPKWIEATLVYPFDTGGMMFDAVTLWGRD